MLQMLEWRHVARQAVESFQRGSWERSSRFGAKPHGELFGSSVGIVGYGGIGRALATRLRPFGVRILAANRSPVDDPVNVDESFSLDRIDRMFEACDFGVLAIALGEETKALIGERELDALGPRGVLVNVARGPVVDEDALWTCLSSGRLGGAVLDVWYRYPNGPGDEVAPSRHPVVGLPNVIATPHISGWTYGTVDRRWADIVENIRRVGSSKQFLNVVKPAHAVPAMTTGSKM
jgi:phosphoglycerate dehydrogenase-like enzyme